MEEFCWSWWFFYTKKSLTQFLILYFWWDFCSAMVYLIQYCSSLFGTHILWNPHHSRTHGNLLWNFLSRRSFVSHQPVGVLNSIKEVLTGKWNFRNTNLLSFLKCLGGFWKNLGSYFPHRPVAKNKDGFRSYHTVRQVFICFSNLDLSLKKMRVAIKSIHRVTRRFNKLSLHTNVRNAFLIRMLGLLLQTFTEKPTVYIYNYTYI